MSWLVPVLGLSVVAAAIAYVVGIGAARMLGAKLASFVGLTEVLFAVLFAWLLLGQLPTVIQLLRRRADRRRRRRGADRRDQETGKRVAPAAAGEPQTGRRSPEPAGRLGPNPAGPGWSRLTGSLALRIHSDTVMPWKSCRNFQMMRVSMICARPRTEQQR